MEADDVQKAQQDALSQHEQQVQSAPAQDDLSLAGNVEVDPDKVQKLQDDQAAGNLVRAGAYKDETAAEPVVNTLAPPERHEHTAHDEEGRHLTVDDADFDAEEKREDTREH